MKKRTFRHALIAAASCLIAVSSDAADFQITEDGKPKAVIVLAGSAGAQELAVTALVSHVKQMSGATLPVKPALDRAAIFKPKDTNHDGKFTLGEQLKNFPMTLCLPKQLRSSA